MKSYIKRSWLVILAYLSLAFGLVFNIGRPIHGDALIPLLLIYAALVLRDWNPQKRGGQVVKTKRISA